MKLKMNWMKLQGGRKTTQNKLKYERNKRIYDFQQLKAIRSLNESIISGKCTISGIDDDQRNLLEYIV